jgi:hypothetical protein
VTPGYYSILVQTYKHEQQDIEALIGLSSPCLRSYFCSLWSLTFFLSSELLKNRQALKKECDKWAVKGKKWRDPNVVANNEKLQKQKESVCCCDHFVGLLFPDVILSRVLLSGFENGRAHSLSTISCYEAHSMRSGLVDFHSFLAAFF